jgi:F0F1-type ATP synthase assembly protein I
MKHFENDTIANIATGISCSSTILHFATTWQPLFSLILAIVGIVSGLFAIRYYAKKIDKLDGQD